MKYKKKICAVALLLSLLAVSCGVRDTPDSVSDVEDKQEVSGQSEEAFDEKQSSEDGSDGKTAVADYHYLEMDSEINPWRALPQSYAINSEWMYVTDLVEVEEKDEQGEDIRREYFGITRKRIADDYQEKNYITTDVEIWGERNTPLLLVDREGHCYIFWRFNDWEQDTVACMLEKYGPDGALLWRNELDNSELEGMGERLEQGTVTRDGRIILYSYGADGCAFCYGADGSLEEVYRPELQALEGIAVGKNDKVYGYCVTGKEPVFAELGGGQYVCPVVPLAVYNGYEEGLCLRTREAMFAYEPGSGETRRLWSWGDEYLQVDANRVDQVFQDGGEFTLLCEMTHTYGRQVVTFARVTFEDSSEYPHRQTVLLSTDYSSPSTEFLVQMYNRQSRKYRVVITPTGDGEVLQKQLLRGEGADLMEVGRIYKGDMARQGVFEDLDPYFENSSVLKKDDIMEPVREACIIDGKNVTVIPGFVFFTLQARGDYVNTDDWTVWKFLELGAKHRMFSTQDPGMALKYCMGTKYGEHFIDFENRVCSFDGEEFRRILEACGKWEEYTEYSEGGNQIVGDSGEGDWLFHYRTICNVRDVVASQIENYGVEDFGSSLVGCPGWEGGEYPLQAYSVLAINSASKNKEGAWDFLEYMLSEEIQTRIGQMYDMFPSRKDSFEAYLEDDYTDPVLSEPIVPTAESIKWTKEMVESAIFEDFGVGLNPVRKIISEEAEMYFAGDATLDATVQKIQTRVQLYLDEL